MASLDDVVIIRDNDAFDPRAFRDVVKQTRQAAATATTRAAELQPKVEAPTAAPAVARRQRRVVRLPSVPLPSIPLLNRLEDERVYRLTTALLTALFLLTMGLGYGGSIQSLLRQLILPESTSAVGGTAQQAGGADGDLRRSLIDESNSGRMRGDDSATDPVGGGGLLSSEQIWSNQGRLPADDAPGAAGGLAEGPSRTDWGDDYQHYVVAAPNTGTASPDLVAPSGRPSSPASDETVVPGPAAALPGAPPLDQPTRMPVLNTPTGKTLDPGPTQVTRSDGSVDRVTVPAQGLSLGIPTPAERTKMSSYQDTLASRVIVVDRNGLIGPANRRYLHTVNGLVDTGVEDDGSTQPETAAPGVEPSVESAVEVDAGMSEADLIARLEQMPGVREVVRIGPGMLSVSADRELDELDTLPGVEASTADLLLSYAGTAGQPFSASHLAATTGHAPSRTTPARGPSGAPVVVAVIDAGFTLSNPELSRQWWSNIDEDCFNGADDDRNGFVDDCRGWDFGRQDGDVAPERSAADRDHGNEVAGIIAAARDGYGIMGVAPDATVMPLKVSRSNGSVAMSAVAAAIRYAVANDADIINISLITQSGVSRSSVEVLERAISLAEDAGVMVVTGAGNEGFNLTLRPAWPASFSTIYDNVITVGSGLGTDQLAPFSNTGKVVTVFAQGVSVPTVIANGDIVLRSGTSYAAPAVTGVLANALRARPDASLSELRRALADASVKVGGALHLLTSTTRDLPTGSINLSAPPATSAVPGTASAGAAAAGTTSATTSTVGSAPRNGG